MAREPSEWGVDLGDVFRGSAAVEAGRLSRRALRGPRYRRLFPDVYAPASLPVTLTLRSRAALLLVAPRGVLSGYSAAEVLGASSGPADAPAEVTVPTPRHPLPGLLAHRDRLAAAETVVRDGSRTTTPVRTAYDLARWRDTVAAVAAVDALAHRYPFELDEVRSVRSRHLGARGSRRVEHVLVLVDRRAESPMESRMRVPLVLAGLPPEVQFPVPVEGRRCRLDLAYPAARLGVEFDGAHHRTAAQARADLRREAALARAGWELLRFDAWTVHNAPELMVTAVRRALAQRRSP